MRTGMLHRQTGGRGTRVGRRVGSLWLGIVFLLAMAMTGPTLAVAVNSIGTADPIPVVPFEEGVFAPDGEAALGNKIMFYCGNGGQCGGDVIFTTITAFYVSLGATVDNLTTLPADLSVYRLIFIVLPKTAFTAAQITQLQSFVLQGGRLVAVSEWNGFYNGHVVLNGLLTGLGVPLKADAGPGVDANCGNVTTNIVADQITAGVASIDYAFTDTITVSTPGQALIRTKTGALPMVAVGQPSGAPPRPGADVVLLGDSNLIIDACPPSNDRKTFWKNLYQFSLASGLVCDMQLNKTSFVNGDQVIAQVLRIANPTAAEVAVELKLWFEMPGSAPASFANVGADGSVKLPPGFTTNVGPLTLFTVTAAFPRGSYAFDCRMLNPATGGLQTEDLNPFTVGP